MQTPAHHRIDYIDGLRAVAVLAVVATHTSTLHPAFSNFAIQRFSLSHGPLFALFSGLGAGSHGVDLFFVLSGFCLAYPTLRKLRTNGTANFDVQTFMEKRIVRILPPYLVAVVLTAFLYLYLHHAQIAMPFTMAKHVGLKDFFKQFFLFDQKTAWLNDVFWTLPVEARWYILFPAALFAWIKAPRVFALAIVIAVVWFRYTQAASIDLGVLPAFMAGIVAADLRARNISVKRYLVPIGIICYAIALFFETKVRVAMFWQISAFCFVVLAGELQWLQRILSFRVLAFIGVASYSIYLAHDHVVDFVMRAAYPALGSGGAWIAAYAAGVLAGCAFWLLVERPFTETRLRDRCLTLVRHPSRALFGWLGVKPVFAFAHTPAENRISEKVPVVTAAVADDGVLGASVRT